MNEIWKDVVGYEGLYQVSNLGRVKRLERYNTNGVRVNEKIVGSKNDKGYITIYTSINKVNKTLKVHQLVAEAFLGFKYNKSIDLVIDHIDNDQSNNRLDNLQIITQRVNACKDKSGSSVNGVSFNKRQKKYECYLNIKSKRHHLGVYLNEQEAIDVRTKALNDYLI